MVGDIWKLRFEYGPPLWRAHHVFYFEELALITPTNNAARTLMLYFLDSLRLPFVWLNMVSSSVRIRHLSVSNPGSNQMSAQELRPALTGTRSAELLPAAACLHINTHPLPETTARAGFFHVSGCAADDQTTGRWNPLWLGPILDNWNDFTNVHDISVVIPGQSGLLRWVHRRRSNVAQPGPSTETFLPILRVSADYSVCRNVRRPFPSPSVVDD